MQPLGYQKYYWLTRVNISTKDLSLSTILTLENVKSFATEAVGMDFGVHSPL